EISKEEKTSKEMDQTLKEKERIKEKLTFELNKHRNEVADATVLISDAERELKEEIKKREKISRENQEEELKVNRMDVMLEKKTYANKYDKAKEEYEETTDLESATIEVDQLKNEIKQLGQVNTGAIEEFNRIKERLAFITAQQEDLLEAKQTLYEVISEMDQE